MRKHIQSLPTTTVEFMGGKQLIRKLSTGAIKRINKVQSDISKKEDVTQEDSMMIIFSIIQEGVVLEEGEEPITPELIDEFPLDDVSKLSNHIMEFAGLMELQPDAEGNVKG